MCAKQLHIEFNVVVIAVTIVVIANTVCNVFEIESVLDNGQRTNEQNELRS